MTTFEETVLKELATIKTMLATRGAAPGAAPDVATDYELSGEYGDPLVAYDPKLWTGEPMVGRRFSQTSPAYLEAVAGFCDWKVSKNEEELAAGTSKDAEKAAKTIKYSKLEARRARGWAARLRAKPAAVAPEYDGETNGEALPF